MDFTENENCKVLEELWLQFSRKKLIKRLFAV